MAEAIDARRTVTLVGCSLSHRRLGAYLYFVENRERRRRRCEEARKVFTVEADKIDEVTIKSEAGERRRCKKNGTDWQIVAPADGAAAADAAEVSGITTNLSTLEQQRVIEENAQDLKEFGLANRGSRSRSKPAARSRRSRSATRRQPAPTFTPRSRGKPKVFLIASFLDSTFNRNSFDLRDKSALKFDAQKVDALEVDSGRRTLSFGRANGEWQLVSPAEQRTDPARSRAWFAGRRRADEVDGARHGPEELRARQACRNCARRYRVVAGDASDRQDRGRRHASTRRMRRDRRSSRSSRRSSTS